ncbi:MAG: hypothetical protein KBD51_03810 [Candidatus Levybacteria bacterium]|nr:hypothetical protein [Candidatus Levybacteria bacterium]
MERLININQNLIRNPRTNRFAFQAVTTPETSREYLVQGAWSQDLPTQKPEGTRITFSSVDQFRAARDTYFAWQEIESLDGPFNPEFPDAIIARILKARSTPNPLVLFVPWGVRLIGDLGQSEIRAMDRLRGLKEILEEKRINAKVLIMPADLYATEVNNQVSSNTAQNYFAKVQETAEGYGFEVKPWSAIRSENMEMYLSLKEFLTEGEIRGLLTGHKVNEAISAASRRSGYDRQEDIKKAAFAYLRERIAEAQIVEKIYAPVKVSAVAKNKDNEVDMNLPRLYIIPEREQFPWLK